jgi:hypothetical protein
VAAKRKPKQIEPESEGEAGFRENRERHERALHIQKEAQTWEELPKKIAQIIRELEIDFDGDASRKREFIEAYFATPFIFLESRARECAAVSVRNVTDYRKATLFHEMHILDLAIRHLRSSMKAAIAKEFPE